MKAVHRSPFRQWCVAPVGKVFGGVKLGQRMREPFFDTLIKRGIFARFVLFAGESEGARPHREGGHAEYSEE